MKRLSRRDHAVIVEALWASVDGPFFPEWEFPTLFGLRRDEVRACASRYRPTKTVSEQMQQAIRSALVNLLGYPHGLESEWSKWVSVSPSDLREIFDRWLHTMARR